MVLNAVQLIEALTVGAVAFYVDHNQRDQGFEKTRGSKTLIGYALLSLVSSISLFVADSQVSKEQSNFSSVPIAYFADILSTATLQLGCLLLLQKGLEHKKEENAPSCGLVGTPGGQQSRRFRNHRRDSCPSLANSNPADQPNTVHPLTPVSHIQADRFPFPKTIIPAIVGTNNPVPLPVPVTRRATNNTECSRQGCYGSNCGVDGNDNNGNSNDEDEPGHLSKRKQMMLSVWKYPAAVLLFTSAALDLVGNMDLMGDNGRLQTMGANCVKAATILDLFALVPLTTQAMLLFLNKNTAYATQDKYYLYTTLLSIPFLLIQDVFNIASAFALSGNIENRHKFSLVNGNWHVRAGMSTSMDVISAALITGAMGYTEFKAIKQDRKNKAKADNNNNNNHNHEEAALLSAV